MHAPPSQLPAQRLWPLAGAAALLGVLTVGGGMLLHGGQPRPRALTLATSAAAADVCVVAPPTPYDAALGTDGAGSGWTDAALAHYVHGSSALGPMRAGNLPAFASAQEAERFAAARGGRVLAFAAVDAALLASLDSSQHAGH